MLFSSLALRLLTIAAFCEFDSRLICPGEAKFSNVYSLCSVVEREPATGNKWFSKGLLISHAQSLSQV